MKKSRDLYLDSHQAHHKKHPREFDAIIEDMVTRDGAVSPYKPFAMNVAHHLEGGDHGKEKLSQNYDLEIPIRGRKAYEDYMENIGGLAAMAHSPLFIIDDSEDDRHYDDVRGAREYLIDIMQKEAKGMGHKRAFKEVYRPMIDKLLERIAQNEHVIEQVAEGMSTDRMFHPRKYRERHASHILHPVHEGAESRWENALEDLGEAVNS